MIKIENAEVMGWEHAIRGMRNPMNSWDKSDSGYCETHAPAHCSECPHISNCKASEGDIETRYIIGPNDLDLMRRLAKAGSVDGKFRRMITLYVDITAPLYWWKEFDTYKVGTVANSCSTMHKIHAKEFTLDDFSHEHLLCNTSLTVKYMANDGFEDLAAIKSYRDILDIIIKALNCARDLYNKEKDPDIKKLYWWQMIHLLPSSYNQKRTVMLNYEVLANIYQYRRDHKLDEWRELCGWIEGLPYSEIITCNVEKE